MKLNKETLKEIIREVIAETDGYNNLLKTNNEIEHNWATHMEWKSSTHKEKYGDIIGEVIHHTLLEDGSITHYNVKFGNRTIKNIPANMLEVTTMQEHKHAIKKLEKDKKEEDE